MNCGSCSKRITSVSTTNVNAAGQRVILVGCNSCKTIFGVVNKV